MQYVHFGTDTFAAEKVKKIEEVAGFPEKPSGGFWASQYHPEGLEHDRDSRSSWESWCIQETHGIDQVHAIVFELAKDARIYTIDTEQDMLNLFDKYPYVSKFDDYKYVDWVAMSQDYDGVVLTEDGARLGKSSLNELEVDASVDHTLYPWDVECVCVFNPTVVENCRSLEEVEQELGLEEDYDLKPVRYDNYELDIER